MLFFRYLIVTNFVFSLLLYSSEILHWDSFNDSYLSTGIMLFSWPVSILIPIPMILLLTRDSVLWIQRKNKTYLAWGALDGVLAVASYIFFDKFYNLIGHM